MRANCHASDWHRELGKNKKGLRMWFVISSEELMGLTVYAVYSIHWSCAAQIFWNSHDFKATFQVKKSEFGEKKFYLLNDEEHILWTPLGQKLQELGFLKLLLCGARELDTLHTTELVWCQIRNMLFLRNIFRKNNSTLFKKVIWYLNKIRKTMYLSVLLTMTFEILIQRRTGWSRRFL